MEQYNMQTGGTKPFVSTFYTLEELRSNFFSPLLKRGWLFGGGGEERVVHSVFCCFGVFSFLLARKELFH